MERVRISFGFFTQAAPDNRATLFVYLKHVFAGGAIVESEYFFEYEHHIGHEVDRVVEDYNAPSSIAGESHVRISFWKSSCLF